MLKVRAFVRHSMRSHIERLLAMPLHCCRDACHPTARTSTFCIFLRRRGIAVRTLLWCDRGFRQVFSRWGPFIKQYTSTNENFEYSYPLNKTHIEALIIEHFLGGGPTNPNTNEIGKLPSHTLPLWHTL